MTSLDLINIIMDMKIKINEFPSESMIRTMISGKNRKSHKVRPEEIIAYIRHNYTDYCKNTYILIKSYGHGIESEHFILQDRYNKEIKRLLNWNKNRKGK